MTMSEQKCANQDIREILVEAVCILLENSQVENLHVLFTTRNVNVKS